MTSTSPPVTCIFGDETSHTGHHFLVYGTIDCPKDKRDTIVGILKPLLKGRTEFKWSGDLSRDLNEFVRAIFRCRAEHQLWFRCVVVNTRHADHKKYSGGDASLSLEKWIYNHLLGFARRLSADDQTVFEVTLDKIKEKEEFPALKASLNNQAQNIIGRYPVFTDVTGVDSDTDILVQAADVLAGCVAWVWNCRYNKKSDPHRIALAELIASLADLYVTAPARAHGIKHRGNYLNLGYETTRPFENGFCIWELYLNRDRQTEMDLMQISIEQRQLFAPKATWADVRDKFKLVLRCVRCERSERDYLGKNPNYEKREVWERHRPVCKNCLKPTGILTLWPDPRKARRSPKGPSQ